MKTALILGCSHASGNEIFEPGKDDRDHSYPMHLARMLGYQPTNMAITGGSNDAMFRLAEQYHHNYDIVIACWTGCNRTEVWDGRSWNIITATGAPPSLNEYWKQWLIHRTDNTTGRLNKLKNILALNAICKNVINVDSFWPVSCDVNWAVPDNFWDWCSERNYNRTKFGHFGLIAHQEFAKHIAKNIRGY